MRHPRAFITYSHDTQEVSDAILNYANKLRRDGIDAEIDQYEESPPQGWPMWMDEQIKNAEYVLVVCNKSYFEKTYRFVQGKGVTWEIQCIYQHLYLCNANNTKFIPIIFEQSDEQYIPIPLKPYTYYNMANDTDYKKLKNRLFGITNTQKPPLGDIEALEPRERKNLFFSTPIDISLWDNANWKGMVFLFPENDTTPPIIGLIFNNLNEGRKIFSRWKTDYGDKIDDYVALTIIEPPFSILTHSSGSYEANGEGYFVIISPSLDGMIERMPSVGMAPEETLLVTVSRYLFVNAMPSDKKRMEFKQRYHKWKTFGLLPCGCDIASDKSTATNFRFGWDERVDFCQVKFVIGTSIGKNDVESLIYKEISKRN